MFRLHLLQFLCLLPDLSRQELAPTNRCGDPLLLCVLCSSVGCTLGERPEGHDEPLPPLGAGLPSAFRHIQWFG